MRKLSSEEKLQALNSLYQKLLARTEKEKLQDLNSLYQELLAKTEKEELRALNSLNQELLAKTGIDFLDRLTDMANNEKKTELDCHKFIEKNYPTKVGLTEKDHEALVMLVEFYLKKVDEHDAAEDGVCYGCCKPIEDDYYKPFRSRFLPLFLNSKKGDPTYVTGFFAKD